MTTSSAATRQDAVYRLSPNAATHQGHRQAIRLIIPVAIMVASLSALFAAATSEYQILAGSIPILIFLLGGIYLFTLMVRKQFGNKTQYRLTDQGIHYEFRPGINTIMFSHKDGVTRHGYRNEQFIRYADIASIREKKNDLVIKATNANILNGNNIINIPRNVEEYDALVHHLARRAEAKFVE